VSQHEQDVHGMVPGSHERADGPECRCGALWLPSEGRCTGRISSPGTEPVRDHPTIAALNERDASAAHPDPVEGEERVEAVSSADVIRQHRGPLPLQGEAERVWTVHVCPECGRTDFAAGFDCWTCGNPAKTPVEVVPRAALARAEQENAWLKQQLEAITFLPGSPGSPATHAKAALAIARAALSKPEERAP
jgi:hypothetical protein